MYLIVSLTSYPPRIRGVHKVVESLYRQTIPADKILLYLSLKEFPRAEAELPETLAKLIGQGGFEVRWVHGNLKSHKKYFYAFQEYKDAIVITVDDDKIYAETMIADLIRSHKRFPDAVSARRVRLMLKDTKTLKPYHKWERESYLEEYIDIPRIDLCAIGAGGVCYAPALVNKDWLDEERIAKMADQYDDLWLKYHEVINQIPVVYTKPTQEDITIENSQLHKLSDHNLYAYGNDRCIHELFQQLKVERGCIYQSFFQSLMTWEEYIIQKKKYYAGVYHKVFDGFGDMPLYLYGAGKIAQYILGILNDLEVIRRITAVIVSDLSGNPSHLYDLQIIPLSELNRNRKFAVLFCVNKANRKEIMDRLAGFDYQNIVLDMRSIRRYYPTDLSYEMMFLS